MFCIKAQFTITESWIKTANISAIQYLITLITPRLSHDPRGHVAQVGVGWGNSVGSVSVSGQLVFVDADTHFSEEVLLLPDKDLSYNLYIYQQPRLTYSNLCHMTTQVM